MKVKIGSFRTVWRKGVRIWPVPMLIQHCPFRLKPIPSQTRTWCRLDGIRPMNTHLGGGCKLSVYGYLWGQD